MAVEGVFFLWSGGVGSVCVYALLVPLASSGPLRQFALEQQW